VAKKKARVPTPPTATKKARTAAPPRRPVQAPKVRPKERRAAPRPSGLLLAVAGSGVVALGAVILAIVLLTRGGDGGTNTSVDAALRAAGCTVQNKEPPPFAPDHSFVPTLQTNMDKLWNTFPPAAGAHYGRFAVWGFYRTPVNPRQVVHNEEHGGTVLWWGPRTPPATVDKLEAFYRESPVSMFGTPIAGLGKKVAITAWTGSPSTYFRNGNYGTGHVGVCSAFTPKVEAAFRKFRDAYRGHGPEFPFSTSMRLNLPGKGPG
jgi:hypothetical protein